MYSSYRIKTIFLQDNLILFTSYCEQLVFQFVPGTVALILLSSLSVTLSETPRAHKTCATMRSTFDCLKKISFDESKQYQKKAKLFVN